MPERTGTLLAPEASSAMRDGSIERLMVQLHAKIDHVASEVDALQHAIQLDRLDRRLADQNRWLVFMWVTLFVPLLGLWIRG
jgi:hypothetical protein